MVLVAASQGFSEYNEAARLAGGPAVIQQVHPESTRLGLSLRVGLGDRSAADRMCGMSQGCRPVPARGSDGPAGKAAGLPSRCGGRPAALDRKADGPFRTRGTCSPERMLRTRPGRRGGSAVRSAAARWISIL